MTTYSPQPQRILRPRNEDECAAVAMKSSKEMDEENGENKDQRVGDFRLEAAQMKRMDEGEKNGWKWRLIRVSNGLKRQRAAHMTLTCVFFSNLTENYTSTASV